MEYDLESLVEQRHQLPEWVTVRELPEGTGARRGGAIDIAAFSCWRTSKYVRIAYEIKRSRSDFLRELKNPTKRLWVEEQFHETYFVVAPGVCKPEEVPESWGLLVATKKGDKVVCKKVAMHRDVSEWPPISISAIRCFANLVEKERDRHLKLDGDEITSEDLQKRAAEILKHEKEIVKNLTRQVYEERALVRKERDSLVEPFETLLDAIGGDQTDSFMIFSRMGTDEWVPPKREDVMNWIARASKAHVSRMVSDLRRLQKDIGVLLQNQGEEEDGHDSTDR